MLTSAKNIFPLFLCLSFFYLPNLVFGLNQSDPKINQTNFRNCKSLLHEGSECILKNPKRAREYFNNAFFMAQELGSKELMARALMGHAHAYQDNSYDCFVVAYEYACDAPNDSLRIKALTGLANSTNDQDISLLCLDYALKIASTLPEKGDSKILTVKAMLAKGHIYANNNEREKALQAYKWCEENSSGTLKEKVLKAKSHALFNKTSLSKKRRSL